MTRIFEPLPPRVGLEYQISYRQYLILVPLQNGFLRTKEQVFANQNHQGLQEVHLQNCSNLLKQVDN